MVVICELSTGLSLRGRKFPLELFRNTASAKNTRRAEKEYLGTKVFFKVAFSVVMIDKEVKLNRAYPV
jgi:hypothetical protein